MKEIQIVIILFVILGGIALYFFSESTIFNNEEESISDEFKSDIESKSSNKIEEQPVKKEENDPLIQQEIPNQVPEKRQEQLIMEKITLTQATCKSSNFQPTPKNVLIYDIIGIEKFSVRFENVNNNIVNMSITIPQVNSSWFVADLSTRSIIFSPDDENLVGNTPLFWIPVYASFNYTISNLGDIDLVISHEGKLKLLEQEFDVWIAIGETSFEDDDKQINSVVEAYYEKKTGILLKISENSKTKQDNQIIEEDSIDIITLIESDIDFTNIPEPISIDRKLNFDLQEGSYAIYKHINFDWKIEITDIINNQINITESRSFSADNCEIMRWRLINLDCLIIMDSYTSNFDESFNKSKSVIGRTYEFLILSTVERESFVRFAHEDIGIGPKASMFRITDSSILDFGNSTIEVVIAQAELDGGTIIRKYFHKETGLLIRQELQYEGVISAIFMLEETNIVG